MHAHVEFVLEHRFIVETSGTAITEPTRRRAEPIGEKDRERPVEPRRERRVGGDTLLQQRFGRARTAALPAAVTVADGGAESTKAISPMTWPALSRGLRCGFRRSE